MVRSATGGGDHHDYPNMKKKVPMAKKKVAKKKVATKKKVAARKKVARKVQPS